MDDDGHVLEQVAQVLRALQDAGKLRILHVELRYQPVAVDVQGRFRAADLFAHSLHAVGHGGFLVHIVQLHICIECCAISGFRHYSTVFFSG